MISKTVMDHMYAKLADEAEQAARLAQSMGAEQGWPELEMLHRCYVTGAARYLDPLQRIVCLLRMGGREAKMAVDLAEKIYPDIGEPMVDMGLDLTKMFPKETDHATTD